MSFAFIVHVCLLTPLWTWRSFFDAQNKDAVRRRTRRRQMPIKCRPRTRVSLHHNSDADEPEKQNQNTSHETSQKKSTLNNPGFPDEAGLRPLLRILSSDSASPLKSIVQCLHYLL